MARIPRRQPLAVVVATMSVIVGVSNAVPLQQEAARTRDFVGAKPSALGFDYVHLVQEWPGSFCDTKKGCRWPTDSPTTGFLLHGLWPEFLNGSWPQYCDPAAPFNMTSVQDLLPELHTYWPSLVAADQAAFWAHEWTRHGTCMEPFFGASAAKEHAYFRLVLTLREHFDAWAMLQAQGIGPASTTTWLQVKKALETGWPAKIEVGCNFDKKGTRQLLEVRSCYRPSEAPGPGAGWQLVPMDCPNEASAALCGSPTAPIVVPPFKPV